MLVVCLLIYLGKEILTMRINRCKDSWKRVATYWNIAIIISILLVTYSGPLLMRPKEPKNFQRWQYHVASLTCLLVWVEMAGFFSKIHLFGKYIHMFT